MPVRPGLDGPAGAGPRRRDRRRRRRRACRAGEAGEIAVRRPDPVMFLDYWNQPEATRGEVRRRLAAHRRPRPRRTRTATSGSRAAHDDVITTAGYRIGPAEIEDCLLRHPAVALAAVVGVPDPCAPRWSRRSSSAAGPFAVRRAGASDPGLVRSAARCARVPARGRVRRRAADDRDGQDHAPRAARALLTRDGDNRVGSVPRSPCLSSRENDRGRSRAAHAATRRCRHRAAPAPYTPADSARDTGATRARRRGLARHARRVDRRRARARPGGQRPPLTVRATSAASRVRAAGTIRRGRRR